MTSNATGSRRIMGTLGVAEGKGVVRMEERLDAGIDDLWAAITDPARLARWLGTIEGDLRLGGEYRARYHASGWEGTARIEACEPPNRVLVRSQDGTCEVTLTADGEGTLVSWEERGMPVELLSAYGAGIQVHVEDLADHVAGRERREDAHERWAALEPAYKELAP
jgi:uncharacterized protein YndB with AHSA1/START domain